MIISYPNPILSKICEPVTEFNEETETVIKLLKATCSVMQGLGISAPQIGVMQRIFIVNDMHTNGRPSVFINPVITNGKGESTFKEGCLSVPGVWASVKRYNSFTITAQDEEGNEFTQEIENVSGDTYGTVLQHEIDHLDGVLFIDRLESWEKNRVIGAINKLRKKNDPLLTPAGPKKQKKKKKKKKR